MELPFVYIDPQEKNAEISSVGMFLTQARRILSYEAVSTELKKKVFDLSMECIDSVKRYYQAKEKDAHLTKRDEEYTEKLRQVEKELAVKESVNNELRSAIEKKKLNLKMAQMTIDLSRERTGALMRLRNELEEKNKHLKEQAERSSETWANSLKIASEQRERLKTIMDCSPRIAKQNNEREAVSELAKRLEQLEIRKEQLLKEESRLKKELEYQTATPLRVFVVNFAKMMLRTFEMQGKLKEARRSYELLKAEEAERRQKMGPSDYDVFDASFMSQDITLRKTTDVTHQVELPTKLLPSVQESSDDPSSGETAANELHNSARVEPPHTSCREVIEARTTAVRNYVEQQSKSVASGLATVIGDSDSGNVSVDMEDHMSVCEENADPTERAEKLMTVDGLEHETQDASMNESVDERNETIHSQRDEESNLSDDDADLNAAKDEYGTVAQIEQNPANEEKQDAVLPSVKNDPLRDSSKSVSALPTQETTSSKGLGRSQESIHASQISQQSSVQSVVTPKRQVNNFIVSTPKQKKALSNATSPPRAIEMTQESCNSINAIINRQASPVTEDIPFSFNNKVGDDDFDPSPALNISAHSNDPGTDFLSLMQSANEKKAGERRGTSPDNEFSFSIFGAAAEQAPSSGGGSGADFVFDFGNPTQENDGGGDTSFHFNFDASDDQTGGKDEGFNFFNF